MFSLSSQDRIPDENGRAVRELVILVRRKPGRGWSAPGLPKDWPGTLPQSETIWLRKWECSTIRQTDEASAKKLSECDFVSLTIAGV